MRLADQVDILIQPVRIQQFFASCLIEGEIMFYDLHWQDIFHQEHPNAQPTPASPFSDGVGIIEVDTLAPRAHIVYSFEMRRGDPLHFGAWSNRRIAIVLTTFAEFEKWALAEDPHRELRSLQRNDGRLPKRIRFSAKRKGCYEVVVMNLTNRRAKVIVEAQSQT